MRAVMKPMGPMPMTATLAPGRMSAFSAHCSEQLVGSSSVAVMSSSAAGTGEMKLFS